MVDSVGFSVIHVSQGSVATYVTYGRMSSVYIALIANVHIFIKC